MINELFIKNIDVIPLIQKSVSTIFDITDSSAELSDAREQVSTLENEISSLIDLKIKNPNLSQDTFDAKYFVLSDQLTSAQSQVKKLESKYISDHESFKKMDMINQLLKDRKEGISEFDAQTLRAFLYRIIAVGQNEIVFVINNKKKYSDDEFSSERRQIINLPSVEEGSYYHEKYDKTMKYKVVII